jgi:hypothetical protein
VSLVAGVCPEEARAIWLSGRETGSVLDEGRRQGCCPVPDKSARHHGSDLPGPDRLANDLGRQDRKIMFTTIVDQRLAPVNSA